MIKTQSYINKRIIRAFEISFILTLLAHILYLFIFLFLGEDKLAIFNLFSISIYTYLIVVLVKSNFENIKILMFILQLEITLHAVVCLFCFGWGYGFELIFLFFVLLSFFLQYSNKVTTYIFLTLQVILFVGFCFGGSRDCYSEDLKTFFFVYNLILISVFAVVLSYLLDASNKLIFLKEEQHKEQLRYTSTQDPLTKLLNRHALDSYITKNLLPTTKFAVMICDVDNFKLINDTYGHALGDKVLVKIADIFRSTFRKEDFICRWGGEEFLVLINEASKENAVMAIQRAKDTLLSDEVVNEFDGVRVTMTFGVVFNSGQDDYDIYHMINHADELLYEGKKKGKNKIEI